MHNSLYIHLSFTANEGDRRGSEEDIRELGGGGHRKLSLQIVTPEAPSSHHPPPACAPLPVPPPRHPVPVRAPPLLPSHLLFPSKSVRSWNLPHCWQKRLGRPSTTRLIILRCWELQLKGKA